jgi:transketolase
MSVAIGAAESKKLNGDDRLVYSLHGDGELQEGQIWEAAMYASAKKIDNLICTVDLNGQQIDGSTEDVLDMGSLQAKFTAFGFDVLVEKQGNDLAKVVAILEQAKARTGKGKPVCILLHTEMGNGVDYMMGSHKWHGVAPNNEQLANALAQNEETLGDY